MNTLKLINRINIISSKNWLYDKLVIAIDINLVTGL